MSEPRTRNVERLMRLYWIASPSGRLATAPAPSGSSLERDIWDLQQEKVTTVVSLLTDDEAVSIGLSGEPEAVRSAGMEFISLPIPDFGILDSFDDALETISQVVNDLEDGGTVVVHCRGGIGRSSTIAATALTQINVNADDAMDRIADARGMKVPETPAQRMWVHGYAEWAAKQE